MRFASKYRRYRITAREHIKMTLANGKENVIQHGVICAFEQGGPFEAWEREQAQATFKFRGATQERDEYTPVDPTSRLSLFDTDVPHLVAQWAQMDRLEGLPAGTVKAAVEDFLVNFRANGVEYVQLIPTPLEAPWPKYDELTIHGQRKAEKVAEAHIATAAATGIALEELIAYEKQNRNDARIIEAYEVALAEQAAGEPEPEMVEA